MSHPTDNLVRCAPFELRAKGSGNGSTMVGHFAVFDQWTEIHSWYEGDFLERIAPGAFADVFARGDHVKVLFDHGADPSIGNKPLGVVTSLSEDATGARYEVDLFTDATYVSDLLPALGRNAHGQSELDASFRFRVAGEQRSRPSKPTAHNPEMLDERTITKVEPLYEFGPVGFGAYSGATAGLRSRGSDPFYERLLSDPTFVARLSKAIDPHVVALMIDDGKASDAPGRRSDPAADGPGVQSGPHHSVLRIRAAALAMAR